MMEQKTRRGWRTGHPCDNGVPIPDGWKLCTGPCYSLHPIDDFHDNLDHGGKDTWCKHCVRLRTARYSQITKLRNDLPLVEPRPPRCPICRQERPLVYEHDHATGKHRGWTCKKCNTALGMADDDPETLRRAAEYLEKHR